MSIFRLLPYIIAWLFLKTNKYMKVIAIFLKINIFITADLLEFQHIFNVLNSVPEQIKLFSG